MHVLKIQNVLIHVVDDTSNDQTVMNFNKQEVYFKEIIQNIQMIDFHIITCSIQLNFKLNQYIFENAFEFGRLITKAIESNPCQSIVWSRQIQLCHYLKYDFLTHFRTIWPGLSIFTGIRLSCSVYCNHCNQNVLSNEKYQIVQFIRSQFINDQYANSRKCSLFKHSRN